MMENQWILGILVSLGLVIFAAGEGEFLNWLGAALLLSLGMSCVIYYLGNFLRQKMVSKAPKQEQFDWKTIDFPSQKKDCEIPGSSGACTGIECYVYETCNYAKKKPLPK